MLKFTKLTQSKWALFFSFASMIILGLADNIRGPLFPEVLNYFNLSNMVGSWSFATTSTAAFLASFGSIYALKKQTLAELLLMAVGLMALGLGIMGISNHFSFFLVGSFILGLSIGFMGVAQNLLVSESVAEEQKSRSLSGLHAMYGLASFIAPLIAANSTIWLGSWRAAFFITAGLCLIYGLIQTTTASSPEFIIKKHDEEDTNLKVPLKSLILLGGIFAFYVVAEILIGTRLALYMRTYYKMDLQQSSQYVTYFFMFLLIGRFIFAFKKFSFPLKTQLNLSLTMSALLLILGLKYNPLILSVVGLTMAPFYPLCVSYITSITGAQARKFLTFAMGFQSLAVVSMHIGVGYLTDQLGLFYAFGVGVIALLLSLICLNVHPKKLF